MKIVAELIDCLTTEFIEMQDFSIRCLFNKKGFTSEMVIAILDIVIECYFKRAIQIPTIPTSVNIFPFVLTIFFKQLKIGVEHLFIN